MNMDLYYNNNEEKPLDTIPADGGMTAIFRTIGCVGDSLSSGEFESDAGDGKSGYHDFFEYSWGQFLGRKCGSKVYNFSRGGMTAKEYCESFAEQNRFWNPAMACDAYIIALGCNDFWGLKMEPGSVDDVDTEKCVHTAETFAGYYGEIICKLKKIQPRARFFLMGMPDEGKEIPFIEPMRTILNDFTKKFTNTYFLDLYQYAPVYDEQFKEKFFMRGHMNPMGYKFTADLTAAYIDWIVRHNMKDFEDVGFIGTDYHA